MKRVIPIVLMAVVAAVAAPAGRQKVFPSAMALVAQIGRDVEAARHWFDERPLESLELIQP